MSGHKILIIDDDSMLLYMVERILSRAGEEILLANSGLEGLRQLKLHEPDLVILDIMMPDLDGWEVCNQIRQVSNVPVMMLTALGHDRHIVRGLSQSGADDYLVKPFSPEVLLARVQALLRRAALPATFPKSLSYQDNYLKVDLMERQVLVQGRLVKLTVTEYRLLIYLLQNANRVLSFAHILKQVWGNEYGDSLDYVHVYISRLRQKLEEDPKNPRYLLSVHGVGYRFQKQQPVPVESDDFWP